MVITGTCSWAEKTLIRSGGFYPKEANTAEARLRYYAGFFRTVEIDSTFYAIPDMKNAALWAERTPGGFVFHVKAFSALTGHGVAVKTLPKDILNALPEKDRSRERIYIRDREVLRAVAQRLKDFLVPLKEAGKLGVLVFQFPPWFRYSASGMDAILSCRELMEGFPVAVEFRHGSWLVPGRAESVFAFLSANELISVAADEPQYGTLDTIPFVPRVTSGTAYFRLHGRNRENWLKKGVETSLRYDYSYSDDELKEFIPSVRQASGQAKTTYVMFNNCRGSSAVKNALRMAELLET